MTDKLELKSCHEVIYTVDVANIESIFHGKPIDPDILTVVMKDGKRLYCDEICPIDSLQEEPVSEDLEDEIRKYFLSYKGYPHIMDETEREIKKAIIYFANWQNQQMIDKACNFIYEQLNNGIMECGDIETFINDFKKEIEL